ncbi:MAG: hypothetical protein H0W64_08060 [Gammaproteobacteria bacterium]|nr:hypothetical protein [Gammaproteobacteria bacterium]
MSNSHEENIMENNVGVKKSATDIKKEEMYFRNFNDYFKTKLELAIQDTLQNTVRPSPLVTPEEAKEQIQRWQQAKVLAAQRPATVSIASSRHGLFAAPSKETPEIEPNTPSNAKDQRPNRS